MNSAANTYVVLVFFSSGRRHTRLQGDWSSDVCSSDLSGHRPRSASSPVRARVPLPGARRRTRPNDETSSRRALTRRADPTAAPTSRAPTRNAAARRVVLAFVRDLRASTALLHALAAALLVTAAPAGAARALVGHVVGANGAPLAGASVTAY